GLDYSVYSDTQGSALGLVFGYFRMYTVSQK
ncbi:unnamed protein product, partial [marine sediment metagenome]